MCAHPHVVALLDLQQHKRFDQTDNRLVTPKSHQVGPSRVCGAYLLAFKPGFRWRPPSVFHMQALLWFDLLIYSISDLISDQTRET